MESTPATIEMVMSLQVTSDKVREIDEALDSQSLRPGKKGLELMKTRIEELLKRCSMGHMSSPEVDLVRAVYTELLLRNA